MAWGSLTTLVATFAPKAILDSKEVNFPSSTSDYVPKLGYQVGGGRSYPPGGWQWSEVLPGANDYLVVPTDGSGPSPSGNVDNATAYVHVKAVLGQPDQVDLQYWLFYNFNGSETLRAEDPTGTGEIELPQAQHWVRDRACEQRSAGRRRLLLSA